MASEVQETLKEVVKQIATFVDNAATISVETWYTDIEGEGVPVDEQGNANFRKNARPVAQTIIKFDGDSIGVVPMRKGAAGQLEVDTELLALHERNVRTATMYRSSILSALVGIFKEYTQAP
jgi:O-phosphoseryl-tRNA(Cys) synthetase